MISPSSAILLLVLAPQGDVFDQLDKNADGRIDRNELPTSSSLVRRVLLDKDANGDGVITRSEFLGKVKPTDTPRPPGPPVGQNKPEEQEAPRPASMFDRLDRNRDGFVALEELPKAQRQIFSRLFRGRARLNRDEFQQILKPTQQPSVSAKSRPLFAILDADSNGVVSRTEIDKVLSDPKVVKASGLDSDIFQSALRTSKKVEFTEAELNGLLMPIMFGRELTQYDRNGDGLIELSEVPANYRQGVSRLLKFGDLPERAPVAITTYVDLFRAARDAATEGTSAPPKKLDNIPAAFKVLDENRDGIITPDELSDIAARLQRLDRDLDGALSVDEFIGDPTTSQPRRSDDVANTQPNVPPNRGVSSAPRGGTAGVQRFVRTFFEQFDKDSNGKLTKAEAPSTMLQRFAGMDLDGDGAVSRAEMAEAIISAKKSANPQ